MMRRLAPALALAAMLAAAPLAAQSIDERLGDRVPPETAALVRELAAAAADRGLPIDPLVQKAIEGSAKGVPADRVATALRGLLARLDAAAAALRHAGFAPDTIAIDAGSFALNAGLESDDVTALAREAGQTGAPVILRVAGTLAALGVPAADVVSLIEASLRSGQPPAELLSLPGRVQAEMRRGATPAQAAEGLSRAARAGGRRGPPSPTTLPGRPDRPARPTRP